MTHTPKIANLEFSPMHIASLYVRDSRINEAEALYREILKEQPENREALFNIAQLLKQQGKEEDGNIFYQRFLALTPTAKDIHLRTGIFHHLQGKYVEAMTNFQQAHALGEDSVRLHRAMGDTFLDQGNPEKSIPCYEKILKREPKNTAILALLGEAYRSLNHFDEALSYARQALAIEPDLAFSQRTVAWILMLLGDYTAGLALMEKRLDFTKKEQLAALGLPPQIEKFSLRPYWKGEHLDGKTLLIWTEQGVGDNIMMMRYLPLIKEKGAGSIIVYSDPSSVKTLLCMNDLVVSTNYELSLDTFDLHCSMYSLPYLFGTTIETIPATLPYLHLSSNAVKKWETSLKMFKGLKVGIAWSGSKGYGKDALRSMLLENFAPLFSVQGAQFISLQKDQAAQELQGTNWRIVDLMDAAEDFVDTAALINNLDLVISVDTAVAHLAGALGKPVWLLNRFESEWRWMIDRQDSPWYPSMRIFRQPALHDWTSVIKAVATELDKLTSGYKTMNDNDFKKAEQNARQNLGIGKTSALTKLKSLIFK